MRVQITITGQVDSDPREMVQQALGAAIAQGLVAGRADYQFGRHQSLEPVFPEVDQEAEDAARAEGEARAAEQLATEARARADAAQVEAEAEAEKIAQEDAHAATQKRAAAQASEEGVDSSSEADAEAEGDGAEEAAELGVIFGSVAAAELADSSDLTIEDFLESGIEASGVKGFTVRDVRKVVAAKKLAAEPAA